MRSSFLFLIVPLLFTLSCKNSTGSDPFSGVDLNGYNDKTFFKTQGQEILNRQGEPVVIRGFGLGGWLLPEGYMFNISAPDGGSPTTIRQQIEDLIGPTETEAWHQLFRDNYVMEKDIILMKEWGADHLRIPFHYNLFYDINTGEFIDEGFERMDELLIWSMRNRVDIILDMHAAPGAQSDGPIADSDGTARLWTEPDIYWPITIKIWEEIARRYKDYTIIIGYDLLNEPVTPFGQPQGSLMLADFYSQLVSAVRAIDKNHILFIEGNYYATTFDFLTPPFDDNMVYTFHKYWNATDVGTINYLLDIRSQFNTPLWMGESGENSNPWFHEVTSLLEDNNIGWNWWTHKKLETITSPLSIPTNTNYDKVVEYWRGNGPRPTVEEARAGLFKMAEDIELENNIQRPDVIASLFSPSFGSANQPYTELSIPGTIPAVHYDIGTNGISYKDMDYKRVNSDDNQNAGNTGWEFRNDGVDIESSEDIGVDYNIGWTEDGEWLEYTITATQAANYTITARVATTATGTGFSARLNGNTLASRVVVPNTGGYQFWRNLEIGTFSIPEGTHVFRVDIGAGGFNLSQFIFEIAE